MDFRAALVNNANRSLMNPHLQHSQANEPAGVTSLGHQKAPGEMPTRRRRRRRHHSSKMAIETLVEEDECTTREPECVLQEHTPPYTPLRSDFGEIPTLQMTEASPVAPFSWPPCEGPERVSVTTLNAIAERARERLAIRIQAYWEEKQKVIEAAARIQNAYTTHMESQLGKIVTALEGHLSAAVDAKLDSFKQAWQEELSGTLRDADIDISSRNPHSVDPKLARTARISALEGETQKLMELMSSKKEEQLASNGAQHDDMLAILKQLQEQGQRTDRSLKQLFSVSRQNSIEAKELRDAMTTAGLLPQIPAVNTSQKAKNSTDTTRVEGSAKGKPSFVLNDGKENAPSSVFGLSNSPIRSNNCTAPIAHSPLHL